MPSILALTAAFLFALAAALQQKGALNLPELSLSSPASLVRLAGQTMWLLGTIALLIKQELLLPIVGGVFVMEASSVIIQVASFKLTGKRVFRMSPIHHHFELIGWSEPKVITRFLILAIIFALFSLTTLKLR